jgi:hypothetical protein
MPQPGQCPKPNSENMHKEVSFIFSGRKNSATIAAIQHSSSKWRRSHWELRLIILNSVFICESLIATEAQKHREFSASVSQWQKNHFPKAPILLLKILTAIASNITPKNFLTASKPAGPSKRSITRNDFKTR